MATKKDLPKEQTANMQQSKERWRRYPFRGTTVPVQAQPSPDANYSPTRITTDQSKVMAFINSHLEYSPPGRESEPEKVKDDGLKEFANISTYGIGKADQDELWKSEADYLLKAAAEPSLTFNSNLFGEVSQGAYQKLSNVARKLNWTIFICRLDNEATAFEDDFGYDEEERMPRYRRWIQSHLTQEQSYLKEDNLEICCSLIDYVFSILVRVTTQMSHSEPLQTRFIASSAKMLAKMKILCRDPIQYARESLARAESIVLTKKLASKMRGPNTREPIHTITAALFGDHVGVGKETRRGGSGPPIIPQEDLLGLYSSEQDSRVQIYRLDILGTYRVVGLTASLILDNLEVDVVSGFPVHTFEISSLAYRTGFGKSTCVVSQARNGEISVTSSSRIIRRSYNAFYATRETVEGVCARLPVNQPPMTANSQAQDGDESQTTLCFEWQENRKIEKKHTEMLLKDMRDVISIMIPLICTFPFINDNLLQHCQVFGFISRVKDQIEELPPRDFEAVYSIRTKQYTKEKDGALTKDAASLSESLLARQRLLNFVGKEAKVSEWDKLDDEARANKAERIRDEFEKLSETIEEDWTIDDKCIVVPYTSYVLKFQILCCILVAGGVAIGLSVGSRIEGVDPFGITTFCWALAAFILIVAKSTRVENWPWRDFLLRRVVCRSMTELRSVKKDIDPQLVMVYLLHNEVYTRLCTRGPYNKAFRRPDTDGFSIDIKLGLATLFLSGIVVVKVATYSGPALIYVNTRTQGQTSRIIEHKELKDSKSVDVDLVSFDNMESEITGEKQDAFLTVRAMNWNRVLGIYDNSERHFR